MVAHNMHLRRAPPPPDCIPATGLKVWSDDLPDADDSSSTKDGKLSWREKQRRVTIGKDGETVYTIGTFLAAGAGAWALVMVLFLLWWRPHLYLTGGATGGAFFVGLLLSFVYYANLKKKEQYQQVVSCRDEFICGIWQGCIDTVGMGGGRGTLGGGGARLICKRQGHAWGKCWNLTSITQT